MHAAREFRSDAARTATTPTVLSGPGDTGCSAAATRTEHAHARAPLSVSANMANGSVPNVAVSRLLFLDAGTTIL